MRGCKTPKNPARFARRNVDFTSVFKLFAQKGVSKTPKNPARFARRNVVFPRDFKLFASNGGSQNRKRTARFARRNVDFLRVFKQFCSEIAEKGALRAPACTKAMILRNPPNPTKKLFLLSIKSSDFKKDFLRTTFFYQILTVPEKNFSGASRNQQKFFPINQLAQM